jgi:hypothetical protein
VADEKDTEAAEKNGTDTLRKSTLNALTRSAIDHQKSCEFAGFLTREDDEALYVADQQGTWVIARNDVVFLEDWAYASRAPEFMHNSGRPVRVAVREGATIQEIRPWRICKEKQALGAQARQALEKVFTLGGAPLPIGEHTTIGETMLRDIERTFVRRLGWHPDPNDPRADYSTYRAGSWTMVYGNGY